ncbi:MAG: hypothetical protein ACI9U2_003575 [Bradymonadia bacterium]|jgi:hypothetical protein
MLVFIAIAIGLMSAWMLFQSIVPLTEAGTVTASDWERIEDESIRLLERRDLLIAELRDLEFEAALNKVGPKDLDMLRARYEAEALDVVRQLDEQAEAYTDRIDTDVADRIAAAEQKRAARGKDPVVPAAPQAEKQPAEEPPVEEPPAEKPPAEKPPAEKPPAEKPPAEKPPPEKPVADTEAKASETSAAAPTDAVDQACPACEATVLPDARFCDACGTGLGANCGQCGVRNRAEAKFCKGCGAGLEANA